MTDFLEGVKSFRLKDDTEHVKGINVNISVCIPCFDVTILSRLKRFYLRHLNSFG